MVTLLTIVGLVVGFAAGWVVGRRRRGEPAASAVPATASAASATGPALADVLESHPTGVVIVDRDGRSAYRNSAARAMAGTHVGMLVDEAIERHLARGRRGEHSREVLELYGPPRIVMVVEATPLASAGAAVFLTDVSERHRIDRVRTDFVANISHELKTPIGALAVLAETLIDETDPATVARIASRMTDEAERAGRTIDDLMELSRIELGGERAVDVVPVAAVIDEAVDRVEELAARRGIRVAAGDAPAGTPRADPALVVDGDRRQLVSAVGNLVENAVKYSEPGGLVEVRARVEGEWVEVIVTDQGVGIPQRDLDRIFERFYRVDRARSRATGGTGLGLSIVRHVATNHHGDVVVTSTEGEGSTFVLRLPVRDDPARSPSPSPPGSGSGTSGDHPALHHTSRGGAA